MVSSILVTIGILVGGLIVIGISIDVKILYYGYQFTEAITFPYQICYIFSYLYTKE
jgi:hypothetical protein